MRAKEIIPKKKLAEPVAETDGSMSASPAEALNLQGRRKPMLNEM